jgi:hypothetical protein
MYSLQSESTMGPWAILRVTELAAQPKRFNGTVTLDATRVGRDAGRIAARCAYHNTIGLHQPGFGMFFEDRC